MGELKPFSVQYRHNGEEWSVQIFAEDIEDARRKIRSIGANGEPFPILASFETRMPPAVMMPLLSAFTWLANLWIKIKRGLQ